MNRDEAYERYNESIEYTGKSINVVGEIYDDFESRTCENCECIYKGWACEYHDINIGDVMSCLPKDFGCNKFKRRTDGDV